VSWEPVIGLEIHVHLKTRTKMFCRCPVAYFETPNSQTCPVCLALPGSLPVPNRQAIELTMRLGLALGCEIAPRATFHRKNYFYPDNPKGYQISQYDEPLCVNGSVPLPGADGDVEVGIVRAHLEEDAAKTVHVGGAEGRIHGSESSLVDFNRAGTPLVEIVTAPDLRSADDAKRFLQLLRQTVVELGLSDAEMEKGSMRFDVNVSVRESGEEAFRTRTELKNMNSFNFAAKGIEREIRRQIEIYESGGTVEQETLHFDPGNENAPPLRSKEEAQDYRYFPEPDLVPLEPDREVVERLRGELPDPPWRRIERLKDEIGFTLAEGLVTSGRDDLFARTSGDRRAVANVLMNEFASLGEADADPGALAKAIEHRADVSPDTFREALAASVSDPASIDVVLSNRAVSDLGELDPVIDRILSENEAQVAAYRGGKEGLLGFFVGQVMKETGGKASPQVVNERLREKLQA
jgi:aspartyl-tRNA(Asn)/glutamyl-tRNA(Gln) amidotransferase subunit B